MRQIVLDTETTGLLTSDGHRVIEIGCIEILNRKITSNRFHYYINPQREIDKDAVAIHGITETFLLDKPFFAQIVGEFLDFVSDAELIIHNAPFDVGFLNYELSLLQQNKKEITHYCKVFDTLSYARKKHPGQQNSLDALCKRYGVDNSNRNLHGALLDANLLAEVYLAMTGGQTTLFSGDLSKEQKVVNKISASVEYDAVKTIKTKIIHANAIELEHHNNKLAEIRKFSNGIVLWSEDIEQ